MMLGWKGFPELGSHKNGPSANGVAASLSVPRGALGCREFGSVQERQAGPCHQPSGSPADADLIRAETKERGPQCPCDDRVTVFHGSNKTGVLEASNTRRSWGARNVRPSYTFTYLICH